MINKLIFLFFLTMIVKISSSQSNLYSKQTHLQKSTILIATSNQYKQFEFCIEKHDELIRELKNLRYGIEKKYSYERSPVIIKLVTNGQIITSWAVYPQSSAIEVEGKKYLFDTTLLLKLNRKFPINYFIEEKIFSTEQQQKEYYQSLLKDKKFLYIVPHDFENEWIEKFNLTFRKKPDFSTPVAISKYLDTTFFKTLPKGKYSISYSPFGDAKKDSKDEITMTIQSVVHLYDYFSDTTALKTGLEFFPAYIARKK